MSDPRSSRRPGPLARLLALPNDNPAKSLVVAGLLCLVCSVAVSSAAVMLRPWQERNRTLAMKREILKVAGLGDEAGDVEARFRRVQTRIVDLETGRYAPEIDPASYDPRKAARDPALSEALPPEQDIARIKRRARYTPVYLVRDGARVQTVILPVHGYGLWSTLYGLLALRGDGRTIQGLTFYEQAETAGLGDQVEDPDWQASWRGKLAYDERGRRFVHLVKGQAPKTGADARYAIDGLAGATLTSNGVTRMMRFWLGPRGYGRYLARLRAAEGGS